MSHYTRLIQEAHTSLIVQVRTIGLTYSTLIGHTDAMEITGVTKCNFRGRADYIAPVVSLCSYFIENKQQTCIIQYK